MKARERMMIRSINTANKNRILKLLTGLFLVYVLSVATLMPFSGDLAGLSPISTAWAITKSCDRDGDDWVKDSDRCRSKYPSMNDQSGWDCDDDNRGLTADCTSSGGDGTYLTPTETTQLWSGAITSFPIDQRRNCWTHGFNANTGYVAIGCDASIDVAIWFDADYIIAEGKNPDLCGLLSSEDEDEDGEPIPLIFGDSRTNRTNSITGFEAAFGTEWNYGDICLDNGSEPTTCQIWVRNTAFGNMCHSSELVSGECTGERLIILEGIGTADAALDGELNPFTVDNQAIVLNELTFWIKGIGKNRTDATCTIDFYQDSGGLVAPMVIFNTTPRPPDDPD